VCSQLWSLQQKLCGCRDTFLADLLAEAALKDQTSRSRKLLAW